MANVRRKKRSSNIGSHRTRWHGRSAERLSNGVLELIVLQGGGHIAFLGFAPESGRTPLNVLWESPWRAADPASKAAVRLGKQYGANGVGQFLASFTGHALCLDYFGPALAEKNKQDMPLHGEAASKRWTSKKQANTTKAPAAEWKVKLPVAGLSFQRKITVPMNQSVAIFQETVRNLRHRTHNFHWVQHVTFGGSFLSKTDSRVFLSGQRAISWPHGYEGRSLISSGKEFTWPRAPRHPSGKANLSTPFSESGKGFLASVLLNKKRKTQYVAALNWRLGVVAGYIFSGRDFPWVAVWEENRARRYAPWNGRVQARGMEFGTTPMPIGKAAMSAAGKLFGTPCSTKISARGTRTTTYGAFLATVPTTWQSIRDIEVRGESVVIHGAGKNQMVRVAAAGMSGIGRLHAKHRLQKRRGATKHHEK